MHPEPRQEALKSRPCSDPQGHPPPALPQLHPSHPPGMFPAPPLTARCSSLGTYTGLTEKPVVDTFSQTC